ncbi:protoheme IX farnesyltransferase [Roseivirga pacifica]|uniref:Protoheme IX farnesyltransferase n=1 Tax=Roseivirga pacifica TaxID=1267423 RepID=A0A1I0RFT0_9BACT|nr:heme o synthase [Roseivirga pacifica]RKQ49536.1 protoheme IX farnesyltransferase [Roseivirga pacifica]SEW39638.1 protoheme IX farnesyltransferase [Roseivirga pacifica]
MIQGNSANIDLSNLWLNKAKAYVELLKMRLSLLVSFSSAFGYALAMGGQVDWQQLAMLFVGGYLISGASCTINQVLEKDYDKLMKRTSTRPLPTNRLTSSEAIWFATIVGLLGLVVLYQWTNMLTVGLAVLSMILYSFVYTPLKRVGPIAVFVGAIPGALPPLLGWTAATAAISHEALIIFGIQFIWQFPHFWAIAWVADEDYKKAGFKLLPVEGQKDLKTAFQIMTYTLFLIPLGLLPAYFGLTGINSAVVVTICGVLFLASTIKLMQDQSRKSALRIMFGSFLYLPIVQIALLLDMVK